MREIKAVIQPFMLERVLNALELMIELPGVTLSHVQGWGRTRESAAEPRAEVAGHAFAERIKLEIVVSDELAPKVVNAIRQNARTGRAGDGKIFVSDVTEVVRIRGDGPAEETL